MTDPPTTFFSTQLSRKPDHTNEGNHLSPVRKEKKNCFQRNRLFLSKAQRSPTDLLLRKEEENCKP